jgi:hypothetical protein
MKGTPVAILIGAALIALAILAGGAGRSEPTLTEPVRVEVVGDEPIIRFPPRFTP